MDLFTQTSHRLELLHEQYYQELVKAATDQSSSISFHTFQRSLEQTSSLPDRFQVVSIGGSNAEFAVVSYENHEIIIHERKKVTLPSITNVSVLVDFINTHVYFKSGVIMLNFAYPMTPFSDTRIDGVMDKATKEHRFEGLVGKPVGKTLTKLLCKTGANVDIFCANDTICLAGSDPCAQAALVLGTGFNVGLQFPENLINLESGNFSHFQMSQAGLYVDALSQDPGTQLFEKEVAGAYLYKHFNFYAQQAGLSIVLEETQQLNELAYSNELGAPLAREVVAHSAAGIAAVLVGIFRFIKKPSIRVVIEGSVFIHGYEYESLVTSFIRKLLGTSNPIELIKVPDSTIVGAVRLVI